MLKFFDQKKIIFLAKTSWDYYLHPYRTLYAKELSNIENEVFWINEPTRNPIHFIGSLFFTKRFQENVRVFTPILFSPTLHNLSSFNAWMLRIQLFILCGTLNSKNVVLWSVYCKHHRIVNHYPNAFSIYWPGDLFDPISELDDLSRYNLIMPLTEKSLKILHRNYGGKTMLSTTGCDWELFDSKFRTSEQSNKPKKERHIIGYIGNISSFRLDFETLERLVSVSKKWDFKFYGPIEQDSKTLEWVEKLSSFKNCHFVGDVNYDKVPNAITSFDVGIIPYKLNKFNLGTNPNKFFEYAAMGVVCISSRIPSLEKFSNFILFADSAKDWINSIEQSIGSSKIDSDELRKVAQFHSPGESLKRLEETILQT